MKKYFSLLIALLAIPLFSAPALSATGVNMDHGVNVVQWYGSYAKSLLPNLNLNDQAYILSGSADPSSSATLAPAGSLYMSSNGKHYVKQDAGSSTNWTPAQLAGAFASHGLVTLGNLPTGGAVGTAANTVDIADVLNIPQTTAGQIMTLPSPTDSAHGHVVNLVNTGSAAFALHTAGNFDVTINATGSRSAVWNGGNWFSF